MTVYLGTSSVDAKLGDYIILAPPFIVTKINVSHVVKVISAIINKVVNSINT